MHTHMSLFTDGRNQFFAGDDAYHLSATGKQFIAGLLRHAREISAVFAQWVNSYKRLVPGYEAPVYVAWSQRNRSALIRIPLYKPGSEQATRAEIRCPTRLQPVSDVRGVAARRARGNREGLRARGPDGDEPLPPDRRAAARARDRVTAGDARRGDDEFAASDLMRRAFGGHIFDNYVTLKRKEWDEYRVQLTQWELDRYLGVL